MKYKGLLAAALACLLLAGCGDKPETAAPIETTLPPQTEPVQTVPPTTEPTEPPVTEPELEAGFQVVADGDTLAGGSLLSEGVTYVKAEEFFSALDQGTYRFDEELGHTLLWNDREYAARSGNEGLIRDGTTLVLASPVLTREDGVWVPLEELCGLLNISVLTDRQFGTIYCTAIAADWTPEEGVRIPILMYHGVTDNTWGFTELFVSPSDMEQQIQYLVENGYDTITFEDWSHLEDFDKPVMLTFDDGYLDNYEELFPILKKYNVKATIFAITAAVDTDSRTMTSAQTKEMADSGLVSIQSHTFSHPFLSECTEAELHEQMLWSKIQVAQMTGYEPFVLCYPSGDSNELVPQIAREYYSFGINMGGGLYTTGEDYFQIDRYYVSRYTALSAFIEMVENTGRE